MRMLHHGSDPLRSTEYKSAARHPRLLMANSASESIVGTSRAPCRPSKPAAVLVTVKDKSLRDRAFGPTLTVTARGSQSKGRSGRGDGRQSAELGDGRKEAGASLTIIAPYRCSWRHWSPCSPALARLISGLPLTG